MLFLHLLFRYGSLILYLKKKQQTNAFVFATKWTQKLKKRMEKKQVKSESQTNKKSLLTTTDSVECDTSNQLTTHANVLMLVLPISIEFSLIIEDFITSIRISKVLLPRTFHHFISFDSIAI